MINRLLNLFKRVPPPLTPVAKRLIPDPERVIAGFNFWMIWRREGKNPDEAYSEQRAFLTDLEKQGMKRNEAGIPLDSPFTGQVLKQLSKWKTEPNYQGSATLTFKLRLDAKPDWEWFEIRTNPCSHPPLDKRKFECRADRMPSHLPWIYGGFISEQCKKSIEVAGLTGLEFTWVSDVGRYQASQWFHAMATKPLWPGLDRPVLFDKNSNQTNSKTGISTADALEEMFPKGTGLKVFPQALRKFIPSTDFAFAKYGNSAPVTSLTMCCTARARDFLISQGILHAKDFVPIWIWDSPPEGAELIELPDRSKLLPYPLIEPEWKWVQEQLPARRAAFSNNPKQVFNLTANRVLEKFQTLRKLNLPSHPTAIQQASSNSTPNQPTLKLPVLWERVLDISEDFSVYTDEGEACWFEVIPRNQLENPDPLEQAWFEEQARDLEVRASDYVRFASSDGDFLTFDLKGMTDEGDCRVVKWCHDPLSISREWPSIIQLLAESLELEETGYK